MKAQSVKELKTVSTQVKSVAEAALNQAEELMK